MLWRNVLEVQENFGIFRKYWSVVPADAAHLNGSVAYKNPGVAQQNMTMFAVLLVTALYFASINHALEIVVDNKGRGCLINREFREEIDKFHNGLRQRVAKGESDFGPAREMYGLVYDCSLEQEADYEVRLPGYADLFHRGLVRFSGVYDESALSATKKALKMLNGDEESMRQLIYPKATRFGCTLRAKRSKENGQRRMEFTCVYDKKPGNKESLEGGNFCKENKDCTYYKRSTCEWNLCYTFF